MAFLGAWAFQPKALNPFLQGPKQGHTCTILLRWERSSASQHASSLWRLKGSRLLRMLPVNSTGTCKDASQVRRPAAETER